MEYKKYQKLQATNHQLLEKLVISQTKSSCLPVYILLQPFLKRAGEKRLKTSAPIQVLDACAAPGNKTL